MVALRLGVLIFQTMPWLLVGLLCRYWPALLSHRMLESVFICACFISSVSVFCSAPWYAAKFSGHDAKTDLSALDSGTGFTDSGVLLTLVCILVFAHVGVVPLRWVAVVCLAIFHVFSYGLVSLLGFSPEPREMRWFNVVMFSVITATLSVGKRRMETYEREADARLIYEKVLRCQSEHRVAQLEKSSTFSDISHFDGSDTRSARIFQDDTACEKIAQLAMREQWLIHASELEIHSEGLLGEGSFGVVVRASYHGADVAVKSSWRAEQADHDGARLLALLNEMRILRHLRHPSIIGFVGACIDIEQGCVGLVLEYVDGVSLEQFISFKVGLVKNTVSERVQLVSNIRCGIEYIHARSPPIVHGDLKPSNILVSYSGPSSGHDMLIRAKILDFGLSRVLTRNAKPLGGSVRWMAPEVILGEKRPALPADVFSFGMTIFYIATSTLPNASMSEDELCIALSQGRWLQLHWVGDCVMTHLFRDIVVACVQIEPERRPSINQVRPQSSCDEMAYLSALEAFAALPTLSSESKSGDDDVLVSKSAGRHSHSRSSCKSIATELPTVREEELSCKEEL
eukprot:TRINITY_DN7515_c0_g1_i3.p1 TRINITY_DN7515_c0_g1~~TRINITY_DN7515_c0_g1_i3.p1  ORF type:complete len:665 (+),score=67.59 TRINITY_DN7515_c0_g1_i3:285-1997(+)